MQIKEEDDLTYENCMEDEIDNTLDMIKDFISEEKMLEIERKLKEKYGV